MDMGGKKRDESNRPNDDLSKDTQVGKDRSSIRRKSSVKQETATEAMKTMPKSPKKGSPASKQPAPRISAAKKPAAEKTNPLRSIRLSDGRFAHSIVGKYGWSIGQPSSRGAMVHRKESGRAQAMITPIHIDLYVKSVHPTLLVHLKQLLLQAREAELLPQARQSLLEIRSELEQHMHHEQKLRLESHKRQEHHIRQEQRIRLEQLVRRGQLILQEHRIQLEKKVLLEQQAQEEKLAKKKPRGRKKQQEEQKSQAEQTVQDLQSVQVAQAARAVRAGSAKQAELARHIVQAQQMEVQIQQVQRVQHKAIMEHVQRGRTMPHERQARQSQLAQHIMQKQQIEHIRRIARVQQVRDLLEVSRERHTLEARTERQVQHVKQAQQVKQVQHVRQVQQMQQESLEQQVHRTQQVQIQQAVREMHMQEVEHILQVRQFNRTPQVAQAREWKRVREVERVRNVRIERQSNQLLQQISRVQQAQLVQLEQQLGLAQQQAQAAEPVSRVQQVTLQMNPVRTPTNGRIALRFNLAVHERLIVNQLLFEQRIQSLRNSDILIRSISRDHIDSPRPLIMTALKRFDNSMVRSTKQTLEQRTLSAMMHERANDRSESIMTNQLIHTLEKIIKHVVHRTATHHSQRIRNQEQQRNRTPLNPQTYRMGKNIQTQRTHFVAQSEPMRPIQNALRDEVTHVSSVTTASNVTNVTSATNASNATNATIVTIVSNRSNRVNQSHRMSRTMNVVKSKVTDITRVSNITNVTKISNATNVRTVNRTDLAYPASLAGQVDQTHITNLSNQVWPSLRTHSSNRSQRLVNVRISNRMISRSWQAPNRLTIAARATSMAERGPSMDSASGPAAGPAISIHSTAKLTPLVVAARAANKPAQNAAIVSVNPKASQSVRMDVASSKASARPLQEPMIQTLQQAIRTVEHDLNQAKTQWAKPNIDMNKLTDQLFKEFSQRIRFMQQRKGM
jgi:hypothetical protein